MQVGFSTDKRDSLAAEMERAFHSLGEIRHMLKKGLLNSHTVESLLNRITDVQIAVCRTEYCLGEMESWSEMAKEAGTELELRPDPENLDENGQLVDLSDIPSLANGDNTECRVEGTTQHIKSACRQYTDADDPNSNTVREFDFSAFEKHVENLRPRSDQEPATSKVTLCDQCQRDIDTKPQSADLSPVLSVSADLLEPQQSRPHTSSSPLSSPLPSLDLTSGHFGNLKITIPKSIVQNEGEN